MVRKEDQNKDLIDQLFNSGYTIWDLIKEGYFENTISFPMGSIYSECPHCGSRYKDKEKMKEKEEKCKLYRNEICRLHNLFKYAIAVYYDVPENDKFNKAFEKAWDKGHSSGFNEVINEFLDYLDFLK